MKRRTTRWGRILFNTLTAISLLLAIATAGLWVRSTFLGEQISWRTNTHYYSITLHSGTADLDYIRNESATNSFAYLDLAPGFDHSTSPIDSSNRNLFPPGSDFWMEDTNDPPTYRYVQVSLPIWLPQILLLLLPMTWGAAALFQRRKRPGRCPACGYDTRANPAKCSECGHEIASDSKIENA